MDVIIYYNGWVSPRTHKALALCGCGVKLETVLDAQRWCTANGLRYA